LFDSDAERQSRDDIKGLLLAARREREREQGVKQEEEGNDERAQRKKPEHLCGRVADGIHQPVGSGGVVVVAVEGDRVRGVALLVGDVAKEGLDGGEKET
jgi:hypothetical protein